MDSLYAFKCKFINFCISFQSCKAVFETPCMYRLFILPYLFIRVQWSSCWLQRCDKCLCRSFGLKFERKLFLSRLRHARLKRFLLSSSRIELWACSCSNIKIISCFCRLSLSYTNYIFIDQASSRMGSLVSMHVLKSFSFEPCVYYIYIYLFITYCSWAYARWQCYINNEHLSVYSPVLLQVL
jgi:hypothetical protein